MSAATFSGGVRRTISSSSSKSGTGTSGRGVRKSGPQRRTPTSEVGRRMSRWATSFSTRRHQGICNTK
ncbi:hypothetical protein [Actinoallomurus acaciae]|uniref:Uncharacterized protein n=1 Tax=Actinoallomurus acaciae TaxID=502577 RepID=A0ABV5YMZ7_9ACTN